ncbi:MAG: SelT/SelW/SelH family protein [FCB group bacterium]|nr:SelT/SelW/SelH family protein [FCB group bacterium]
MSKLIKVKNPNADIQGNPSPPRTGAFEVTIDGKLVFSKFQTNRFPTDDEVMKW